MDDTCVVLPANKVADFHQHLNSIETSIQFTVELEKERKLPFLDVLLIRNTDVSIDTSVYRKPTRTDQYLSFLSTILQLTRPPWCAHFFIEHELFHQPVKNVEKRSCG